MNQVINNLGAPQMGYRKDYNLLKQHPAYSANLWNQSNTATTSTIQYKYPPAVYNAALDYGFRMLEAGPCGIVMSQDFSMDTFAQTRSNQLEVEDWIIPAFMGGNSVVNGGGIAGDVTTNPVGAQYQAWYSPTVAGNAPIDNLLPFIGYDAVLDSNDETGVTNTEPVNTGNAGTITTTAPGTDGTGLMSPSSATLNLIWCLPYDMQASFGADRSTMYTFLGSGESVANVPM